MNSILLYFLKSAAAMALFYGVYRFFLEKETHYSLNRLYLVGTLILALVLPLLPLENILLIERQKMPVFIITGDQGLFPAGITIESGGGGGFRINALMLAGIVYLSGVGLLTLTLAFQLLSLLFIKRNGLGQYGPLKIIFVNRSILPFSILNFVFLDKETRNDPKINTILEHEYAHYRSAHFADLVLFEFITIFQWFNPLAWLYVRSLKEIHEYQADAAVLRKGERTADYKALLVNQLTGTEVFRLSSSFSKSLTKKRMIMMTKIKSKKNAWMKALLAMPALAILLIAFAANEPAASTIPPGGEEITLSGKVVEDATGEPMPGVSIVWQGTTNGTVSDMDGSFKIKAEGPDPVIVFSFVGYRTQALKAWGEKVLVVRMKTRIYTVSEYTEEFRDEKVEIPENGPGTDKELFVIVEDMPAFQGKNFNACRPWVQEHVVYPAEAKERKIQGVVMVGFTVNGKGKVVNARVQRGVDPLLDREALRAVSEMPDWSPGKQRGKPVATMFIIPVEFRL